MKLEITEKANRDYLAKLNKRHRNLISKKEREIKNINSRFNEKIKNTKLEGIKNLANQEEINKGQIVNSIQNKEEKLEKIKTDLSTHQMSLAKEKERLSQTYNQQIQNTNEVFKDKYDSIYKEGLSRSEEIVDQTNNKITDLKKDSDFEIKSMNFESKLRADNISRQNAKSLNSIDIENRKLIDRTKKMQERRMDEIRGEHEKKIVTEEKKHAMDYRQRVTSQQTELSNIEAHHNEVLKQKRLSFQEKYKNLENNHKSILKRIKEKFDSEIKNVVKKYSELKNQTLSKSEDPFYNVTELSPRILELDNMYQVQIDVPEHEQELINLTAQKRDIHISLTRNYRDQTKTEDGELNKTRRSEVLTKQLDVPDIMDSKKITRVYKDGTLSFNIAKL